MTDVPVALSLPATRAVTVDGDRDACRAAVRALVSQLSVAHHPEVVGLATILEPAATPIWDWLKWLAPRPHVESAHTAW